MHTANKCVFLNVHLTIIRCYLSLPLRAPLCSHNVGFTFFSPLGQESEITGNVYAHLHFNHRDVERQKEGERISFAGCLALCILQRVER